MPMDVRPMDSIEYPITTTATATCTMEIEVATRTSTVTITPTVFKRTSNEKLKRFLLKRGYEWMVKAME